MNHRLGETMKCASFHSFRLSSSPGHTWLYGCKTNSIQPSRSKRSDDHLILMFGPTGLNMFFTSTYGVKKGREREQEREWARESERESEREREKRTEAKDVMCLTNLNKFLHGGLGGESILYDFPWSVVVLHEGQVALEDSLLGKLEQTKQQWQQ